MRRYFGDFGNSWNSLLLMFKNLRKKSFSESTLKNIIKFELKDDGIIRRINEFETSSEMVDSFKIEGGEITFETDKIKISDNSKKQNLPYIISSIIGLFWGVLTIIHYFTKGNEDVLWLGFIITSIHLVVLTLNLFRTHRAEIFFDEIKSIKLKQRPGGRFLDIKLKNQKLRRVSGIHNKENLQNYLNEHVALKVN